jgi:alpha-tubulin suppressor-like RCC1 family protein
LFALVVAVASLGVLASGAVAEQASEPPDAAAGQLDAGANHTCALLADNTARCWGFGGDGRLGYGNQASIGDNETPGSVGPVDLGPGRTSKAISAGDYHTCVVLADNTVQCWGFGGNGRLGYANRDSIGDDETPGSAGPVDLGPGRTAKAITAGGSHTCALLNDNTVRCWGFGGDGELGHANKDNIGDNETPGSVGPVDLGGHTAKAITAGLNHTCALLDDDTVRCWGLGADGRLGYGNISNIGDDETPGSAGPVNLGLGRKAKAISAGSYHTCALLDDDTVRCWGFGSSGRLGYGNQDTIGDNETPGSVGPVDLGGHKAKAISAGADHTCAVLDDDTVRCWGFGGNGQLGYGNTSSVGVDGPPGAVGPVDLGRGRNATAISAGEKHTCARLDDQSVRCWGYNATGQLGYCTTETIGDDETPGSVGPVALETSGLGKGCSPVDGGSPSAGTAPTAASGTVQSPGAKSSSPIAASEARRAGGLRKCLMEVAAHANREKRLLARASARQRGKAKRHLSRHARSGRQRCLQHFGRVPGRVTRLRARTLGKTRIQLDFNAPGTDADNPPPARSYVVKQSSRPIRGERGFTRAQALCHGACRFRVSRVGAKVMLTVTDLRPHTTYYYVVAARDNVSAKRGHRSQTVKARTLRANAASARRRPCLHRRQTVVSRNIRVQWMWITSSVKRFDFAATTRSGLTLAQRCAER